MNFSLKRKTIYSLRTLLVIFLLLCFSFIAIVPPINAQTQLNQTQTQSSYQPQTPTENLTQPQAPPKSGKVQVEVENGQVLGCGPIPDPTGLCDTITGAVGGIGGQIVGAILGNI